MVGIVALFGKGNKKATGVHIEDHLLRIVELVRAGGDPEVGAVFRAELPGSDLGPELREALRRAARECSLSFANTCISLGWSQFYLKHWPLVEGANAKTNRHHLLWEASQFLAADLKDYGIDTFLGQSRGFVVAVRRRVLEHYREFCLQSGLKSPELDVVPFALCNALEGSRSGPAAGMEMLVGFSRRETSILLLRDGDLAAVESRVHSAEPEADWTGATEKCIDALLGKENRGENPERLWVADLTGCADSRATELSAHYSIRSAVLDPFRNLRTTRCKGAQQSLLGRGSEFAVAAGLAHRGLAEK